MVQPGGRRLGPKISTRAMTTWDRTVAAPGALGSRKRSGLTCSACSPASPCLLLALFRSHNASKRREDHGGGGATAAAARGIIQAKTAEHAPRKCSRNHPHWKTGREPCALPSALHRYRVLHHYINRGHSCKRRARLHAPPHEPTCSPRRFENLD